MILLFLSSPSFVIIVLFSSWGSEHLRDQGFGISQTSSSHSQLEKISLSSKSCCPHPLALGSQSTDLLPFKAEREHQGREVFSPKAEIQTSWRDLTRWWRSWSGAAGTELAGNMLPEGTKEICSHRGTSLWNSLQSPMGYVGKPFPEKCLDGSPQLWNYPEEAEEVGACRAIRAGC